MVTALLVGVGPTACTNDVSGSAGSGYVSGAGVITTLAVGDREKPGEVSGETLDGKSVALTDFAGQVVVVNVWGSWCPPCRAEAPDLVAAADELAGEDVVFLGINSRDLNQAAARAFVRRFDILYPSIYDQQGETLLAFRDTLSPNSIPSTVIIDEQGRVAASVLGQVSKRTLLALVDEVSTGSAPSDSAAGGR